jgi:uncharacterized protein
MAKINQIENFMAQEHIAVAGISRTPHKFGNNAFKELKSKGYDLYPISLHLSEFEGVACYKDIASLPDKVSAIFICTRPDQTKNLLEEARAKGIQNIWLQQGSADKAMIRELKESNESIVTEQCILMFTKQAHFMHRTHAYFKKLFGQYPN